MQKSILGGLLTNEDTPKIREDVVTEGDIKGKFKNYIKKSEANEKFI